MFYNALVRVLAVLPDLFPPDIQTPEDIKAKIQSFRSLRRSSNARAVNKAIAKIHVGTVNRWVHQERAGDKKMNLALNQHYAQIEELRPALHAYTFGM
jgi:hypothetical protein